MKLHLPFLLLLFIRNLSPKQARAIDQNHSTAAANCLQECGRVSIPYPFGIENCSLNHNFSIYCNTSFNTPKPFLKSIMLEIKNISVFDSTVQVNSPVLSNFRDQGALVNLSLTPFSFSGTDNTFTAVGCNNLALLTKDVDIDGIIGGCMSYCDGVLNTSRGLRSCFGVDCCQTTTPRPLKVLNVSFRNTNAGGQDEQCHYALMVGKKWLAESDLEPNISSIDRLGLGYVPAVLDWAINIGEDYGTCSGMVGIHNNGSASSAENVCASHAHCSNKSEGYVCVCDQGYAGNPYDTSCIDIDECANGNRCGGGMICTNTPGGYNCSCRFGYSYDGFSCNPIPYGYIWILAMLGQGGGLMLLLGCLWGLYRVYKTRKDKRLKKKHFRLNGGLLLQEKMCSSTDTVKKIELFTSKELEKATDDYNRNRILGGGGQGTVYKGMLTDGRVVAVKLSKPLEAGKVKQFINEVIILSKINHRNVVKILGCCLESELPMLVYEFIPNGTLFDYIHDINEEVPFSWDVRFQIAIEIAVTLCYLHSLAETPIFHRDIKSTNILLDESFRAKVADFGISMSVSIDQTHMTTMVRGTFGYLDPEYFRTSQFTEKSDVYSFGVVLVELLTGLKPIFPSSRGSSSSSSSSSSSEQDHTSLAIHFMHSMEQRSFFSMVDVRIAEVASKGEIMALANVARRCLNMDGKKRPTMKAVAMELESIRINKSETSRLTKLATRSMNAVLPNLCNPTRFV